MTRSIPLAIILLAPLSMGAQPPARENPAAGGRGERLYTIHCFDCHGATGSGGGPKAATLRQHPTDLTRLSIENDNVFPRERITRVIDGRDEVALHGSRDMPVWGMTFVDRGRVDAQETEIRDQIRALVDYIESLQHAR